MPILTIAIPTYNRPEEIRATVERLLPQMTPQCRLLILDNHSDMPVSELLAGMDWRDSDVQILRNGINIGASGNVTRCLEQCETDWIWLLSDDDIVFPDSVARVLGGIARHPDFIFIGFNQEAHLCPARDRDSIGIGIGGLLRDSMPWFGNLLFLSTSVLHLKMMRAHMKEAFYYASSYAPQVALLLRSMDEHSKTVGLKSLVVRQGEAPAEQHWAVVPVTRGMQTLCEIENLGKHRKLLQRRISEIITLRIILFHTLATWESGLFVDPYRMFTLLRRRYFILSFFSARNMLWSIVGLSLLCPRITSRALDLIYRAVRGHWPGKPIGGGYGRI